MFGRSTASWVGVCSGSRLCANTEASVERVCNRKAVRSPPSNGFALRIGQRAALVPTPGARVYGLVFSLTRSELDRLYSESSVQAYKPQAVLAHLASGGVVAALCYNLPQPPSPRKRRPRSQKTVTSTRFIPQIQSDFGPRSPTGGAKSISPSN